MRRLIIIAVMACSALAACTVVKIGEGDTSKVEHDADADAQALANRACRRAGRAEIVSTVNKDASQPAGTGRQVTTFRCISG